MAAMRAPKNNAKGTSGQSFVKGQFEELGWGAIPNLEHDVGTDLFVMARDARRFDLGALVGAQVKNWALEFDAPATHEGREGWWYADDEEHFDYWTTHRVPHILVFYDKDAKVSYWVHIVEDAVISTGKGRKVFVPKTQTVDLDHFEALLEVALSSSTGKTWEGSAWTPGQEIPDNSQLRYALLAPRLIAPHGNASTDTVTAAQAVALVSSVRLFEVHRHYEDKQPLLDPTVSAADDDFEWRLYAALLTWVEKGERAALEELTTAETTPEQRAATVVMNASALFEDGKVRSAIKLLTRSLEERDDYNPVDHAWLRLHLARNLLLDGSLRRARSIALEVAMIGQTAPEDPTARFLSGTAADMLFTLSGWAAADLEQMIKARDNAASWWRGQKMSVGLGKHLENAFKTWANDKSITIGGSDETWTNIRAAMLISNFGGDTSSWRYEACQLARHILMTSREVDSVSSALELFLLAGSKSDIKHAVTRLLDIGPVAALVNVAERVDLRRSTRDSLHSDLELLGLAGKVLPTAVADRAARMLLSELADPGRRLKRLRPSNPRYEEPLALALARTFVACSKEIQAEVRSWVCSLPPVDDELIARGYALLVRNVRDLDWSEAELNKLRARPGGDTAVLANAIEALLAGRDPELRAGLIDRIAQGDTSALASWGNVTELPERAASGMIESSAKAVRSNIDSAHKGMYGYGSSNDALHTLVLLNLWHPAAADWDACVAAIADEQSSPDHLASGVNLLIRLSEKIPDAVREQLREPLARLASRTPDPNHGLGFFNRADIRGDALLLLNLISPDEASDNTVTDLLSGAPDRIQAGIRLIAMRREPSQLGALAALSTHSDLEIRSAVAGALAEWLALDVAGEQSRRVLTQLLSEPGVELATRVSRTLFQTGRSASAEVLANELASHPSAVVRAHVTELLRTWDRAEAEDVGGDRE
ncbi:hypothetical protein A4X17_05655 [Plantibacter sp. H53]|uniref:DUF4365 domain-containing protein n=1 Tax=Plantibacter sp. H53 TaxID=1827323 RepID=UPI0007D9E6F2|nr:DUF4365 domain-containing protein [Plantibacter sp. H53]OAN29065.1 hypothetical protein A4X17_05655 [Plantibacter sp. H53]